MNGPQPETRLRLLAILFMLLRGLDPIVEMVDSWLEHCRPHSMFRGLDRLASSEHRIPVAI